MTKWDHLVESIKRRADRVALRTKNSKEALGYLQKRVRPGDILVVGTAAKPTDRATKAYYEASVRLFGDNKNIHAGMYVGKGKTVDAYYGTGVTENPIGKLVTGRNHISVLRPRTGKKNRRKAIEFARKQVGKSFSRRKLIGAGLKAIHPRMPAFGLQMGTDSYICSGLLADAYPKFDIAGKKTYSALTAPKDFRKSKDFREVFSLTRATKNSRFKVVKPLKKK